MSTGDAQRAEILDEEMLRSTPKLIRRISAGIFKRFRKLGLHIASTGAPKPNDDEADRQLLIITWMLDLRTPLDRVKDVALIPPDEFAKIIEEYDFDAEPALLMEVRKEITRTQLAVQAAAFDVEAKPGGPAGPSPQGKS